MTDKQITIRMPKKLLADWLKALRSGGYKQAKGSLHNPKTGGFCCLGVLQHVASGGYCEVGSDKETFRGLPSKTWLRKNRIAFDDGFSTRSVSPWLWSIGRHADSANDSGTPFKKLADAIEACAEGI